MAHKAGNGWIAPFPDHLAFEVEQQEGRKTIRHSPSGIFVHGSTWAGVYMNYAGLASSGWSTFRLPADGAALRELADALHGIADVLDRQQGR